MDKINMSEQIAYWKNASERDMNTATDLFKTKHYDSCLFFCHLTLEKILKALAVKKTNEPAPYIHHLEKLAEISGIALADKQKEDLRTITGFNISGRYDNVKFSFYKQCNKAYTEKYLDLTKKLYLWLKEQFQNN